MPSNDLNQKTDFDPTNFKETTGRIPNLEYSQQQMPSSTLFGYVITILL
jgi:hypothetical protein